MAAATPSVAPAAAASSGGAAADATAWRGVMPTACRTWRSATVGRGVPGHGLADQEERGQQRRQGEGEQAGGLVPGDPQDRAAEVLPVVPHVDVRPAGHPGQVGAERGDGRGAALEPDQRVDVRLPAGAEDVGAVAVEQGRRGAARRPSGPARPRSRPEDVAAHPDDPGLDAGPARRPGGPVIPLVDLLRGWPGAGSAVADALVVGRRELRGDEDLVDAAGIEQPPGQQERAVRWSGPSRRRSGGNPAPASGQQSSTNPNTTGNSVSAATSGRARILSQSNPGWLGSTVTVAGSVLAQSRSNAVCPRRAPAAAASTVAVASATSRASTSSDRQRRRTSRRSQVMVIRTHAPTIGNRRSQ